jgi:hypothetical protein
MKKYIYLLNKYNNKCLTQANLLENVTQLTEKYKDIFY